MAETVDEITIDWKDENGQQLVRQLKKEVLTSGAWSTIMFMYQDFDKKAAIGDPRSSGWSAIRNGEGSLSPSQNSISPLPGRQNRSWRTFRNGFPKWMRPPGPRTDIDFVSPACLREAASATAGENRGPGICSSVENSGFRLEFTPSLIPVRLI